MLDWNGIFSFTNEPSVTEVAPGKLLMFMRTGLGRLFQSWSHDSGETWTRPAATSLASSTAPPQIKTFSNGHLLCVWNQQSEEEVRQGYLRTRLSSAVSRNGGSLWEFFQNVESIHEETRVVPGPVRLARPAEYHFGPEVPAPELDDENVTPADALGTWTYPSVTVFVDRVFVAYRYTLYREHPEYAQTGGEQQESRCVRIHPQAEGVPAQLVLRRQEAGRPVNPVPVHLSPNIASLSEGSSGCGSTTEVVCHGR